MKALGERITSTGHVGRLILVCTGWLLGCEAGPIGRDYACFPASNSCSCYSELESDSALDSCPLSCCFIRGIIMENQSAYRCTCYGGPDEGLGPYLNPPADACFPKPGAQRVDACPPTRLIEDEPMTFACATPPSVNIMVTGFALPCAPPDATRGCLTDFDGTTATGTCLSLAAEEECDGISVTACDENLAFHLTETVIDGWGCGMDRITGTPRSYCVGPDSTEVDEYGNYDPIRTYPPPPIPDQCCTYSSDTVSCGCTMGDACDDLVGVEVSACPPPADELAAIQDG